MSCVEDFFGEISLRPPGFIGEVTPHRLATTIITLVVVLNSYVD
jgi:hypothetical protein